MGNFCTNCGAKLGIDNNFWKHIITKFQERNGATQCKLLKGVGTGKPLRDCPDCVSDASEFLEEFILSTKAEE